jgi:long-chain fatty acid transport protein
MGAMKSNRIQGASRVLFAAFLFSRAADAQIESALISKLSFNLSNPGGKSLAMGGAFTAIADDATAALVNPAGLGLLSAIEVGISGKRFDETIGLVTARSTASGPLTSAYPVPRAVNSDIGGTTGSLEFAGVVVPISRRLVAAVAYAENLRFSGDPGPDGYQYIEFRDNRSGGVTRRDYLYEYREYGSVSLANRLLAVSAGYRVSERLRIGAGLTLNRTTFSLDGDAGGPHRIVNVNFTSPTSIDTKVVNMSVDGFGKTKPGFIVGIHADILGGGTLTVGAVYRSSPKTTGSFLLTGDVPAALAGPLVHSYARPVSFSVPRDAALGLAAHPFPGLTIAAELQWIAYGDIADASLPVVSYSGFVGPSAGFFVDGALATIRPPDDVFVPRIGFEYVASANSVRLAFRVGYHREPARGVTASLAVKDASGTSFEMTDPPYSAGVRTVFDGGRGDDRFTGGLGLTMGRAFSLDFAFDVGRSSRQLAASAFYRF